MLESYQRAYEVLKNLFDLSIQGEVSQCQRLDYLENLPKGVRALICAFDVLLRIDGGLLQGTLAKDIHVL